MGVPNLDLGFAMSVRKWVWTISNLLLVHAPGLWGGRVGRHRAAPGAWAAREARQIGSPQQAAGRKSGSGLPQSRKGAREPGLC
jgi:hypothetical protein